MITEVIFDVETQKLFSQISTNDPADLLISIVSAYVREVDEYQHELRGEMKSFWVSELDDLWPIMASAKRIIGFNTIKFDIPALARHAPDTFAKMPHLDIMQSVRSALGHSLSLSKLAQSTLNKDKTDVGTNAVEYWKNHDEASLAKLKYYCEADVLLTKELYDYGVVNKHLKYMDNFNNVQSFPVDFSYPKEVIDASRQIGLF
ncbi:MAG: ribonuclease H-like domain-containing protein [Patescibacteria group bacterium]